jgi:hypothetical protein
MGLLEDFRRLSGALFLFSYCWGLLCPRSKRGVGGLIGPQLLPSATVHA